VLYLLHKSEKQPKKKQKEGGRMENDSQNGAAQPMPEPEKMPGEAGAQDTPEVVALRAALEGETPRAEEICARMAGVLASDTPQALRPLLAEGRLAAYGFAAPAAAEAENTPQEPDALAPLSQIPAVPLLRWWALLHLTGAFLPRVRRAFGWDTLFEKRLAQLDAWYSGGMPADRDALKDRLQAQLPVAAEDAFAAFAAIAPEFAALPEAYAALLASGEPFRLQDVRISDAELMLEGVPRHKLKAVRQALLEAVLHAPELNVWPTLAALARKARWIF
jgi:hypothetical protein